MIGFEGGCLRMGQYEKGADGMLGLGSGVKSIDIEYYTENFGVQLNTLEPH